MILIVVKSLGKMLGIPLISEYINKVVKPQIVADKVDFLNYYATSMLMAMVALAISAKQYFGSPIQCWVPMEFRGASPYLSKNLFAWLWIWIRSCKCRVSFLGGWEKYAEDYCFIQNSYYIPFAEQIPEEPNERRDQISYYRVLCFLQIPYLWGSSNLIVFENVAPSFIEKQTVLTSLCFSGCR